MEFGSHDRLCAFLGSPLCCFAIWIDLDAAFMGLGGFVGTGRGGWRVGIICITIYSSL